MNPTTLESFRRVLVERGQQLLRRRRHGLEDEAQLLDEREPDWEDLAADRSAAAVLESLNEGDAQALVRIKQSLERIDRGTYGSCALCAGVISQERLRAIPETDRCARCAALR